MKRVSETEVHETKEHSDHKHGEKKKESTVKKSAATHVEIEAEARLLCETSVTGKDFTVKLKQHFPKIQKMILTLVPEVGQPQMKTLTNPSETLKL